MPQTVTLTIVDTKTAKPVKNATLVVQDKNVIKLFDTSKLTEDDFLALQKKAKNARDIGVLDYYDFTPEEKLKQAKANNYDKYYDIKLSDDGKLFEITIKPVGSFSPGFNGYDLKADFGLAENVLMNSDREYIIKNAPAGSTPDGKNTDYDKTPFPAGKTIGIPVGEVSFNNGPSGWWRRLFT